MRLVSVVSIAALAGVVMACGKGPGYRGLTVDVKVPVRVAIGVTATADAQAATAAQGRADGAVAAKVEVGAELDAEAAAVPAHSAPEPEFFGISLAGSADVVFVLDRSGSMTAAAPGLAVALGGGSAAAAADLPPAADAPSPPAPPASAPPAPLQKIDVARAQLTAALQQLEPGTRVNVIFFNDGIEGFAPGFFALDATKLEELVRYVEDTTASGRTALSAAMRTALLMNPRRVVLLSDGLGNLGDGAGAILRDAREAMRGGVRIDTVGLGFDQDDALLHALAVESGGVYQRF